MKAIYNAKIYLERNVFCDALLIKDGRILKTGSKKEILGSLPLNAKKIDADGALVLPAFYDSHLHLMWAGRRESGIECAGAKSVSEIIFRGRKKIDMLKPAHGSYIRGSGADPDLFTEGEKRDLCREDLDQITKEHPLIISRRCGHIIYCNSPALKIAGIDEYAPEIQGGTIEKDGRGRPTGVLRENASVFVQKKMPALSAMEMKEHIKLAVKKAHSFGITSCGSYDIDGPDFDDVVLAYREAYDDFRNEGSAGLKVGLQCGISFSEDILEQHIKRKSAGFIAHPFVKMQSIKLFADGTLGGHTAFLRQPYNDKPETSGFPLMEQEKLDYFVQKASENGMQVLIHAIGDAGAGMALCALEKVTGKGNNPLRHGIIHCQIMGRDLLKRMARNKILAIVQPGFLEDDINILGSRVGRKRASLSYAWGSMIKLGIHVCFSTDAPVSNLNPFHCMDWAVSRGDYNKREKIDIYSAIDAYTQVSAYSGFDEKDAGKIKPASFADMVFLDRDIFSIPLEDIQKTKVLKTMCQGEIVYEN